jgi:Transglycosylase SLT domain
MAYCRVSAKCHSSNKEVFLVLSHFMSVTVVAFGMTTSFMGLSSSEQLTDIKHFTPLNDSNVHVTSQIDTPTATTLAFPIDVQIQGTATTFNSDLTQVMDTSTLSDQDAFVLAAKPLSAPSITPTGAVPNMIRQVFGRYANGALAIAACESGFNPRARNPYSGAMGVFQFMPRTWAGTPYARFNPYDAMTNISAAYYLFVRDGYSWREWSCRA